MIHHCAKRFGHVYRLTDDLIVMNNNKEFGKSFKEICPEELELKKENPNDNVATFLDLNIIKKGSFQLNYTIKKIDLIVA